MKKNLTISQRELVRNWTRLKEVLRKGEADQLEIAENGHRYYVSYKPAEKRPGDIRDLLARMKKMGPKVRVTKAKLAYRFKSLPNLFEE